MPTTKKFKRDYLTDTLDLPQDVGDYEAVDDAPAMTVHANDLVGHSRWSLRYSLVFSITSGPDANKPGEAWRVHYQVGATESQDEGPWENEREITATLVHPVEKTVKVWEPAP